MFLEDVFLLDIMPVLKFHSRNRVIDNGNQIRCADLCEMRSLVTPFGLLSQFQWLGCLSWI